MSRITFTCCGWCGKLLAIGDKKLERKHGMCITLGYSLSHNGWGQRRDHLDFSEEVCGECYAEYEVVVGSIKEWIQERAGINAPHFEDKNNVPKVPADKPPSGGRGPKVLRKVRNILLREENS